MAKEQDAALARALHEDEAHRQADLSEVAEEEAEAVPEWATRPPTAAGSCCWHRSLGLHYRPLG